MSEIAHASINKFAPVAQQAEVSPEEPILEIPVSEFQGLLNELAITYNMVAEMVRDSAILRGRELARMTTEASNSIKVTGSPIDKVLLLNAHTRRLLAKVREALKTRPSPDSGKVIQVCTKIMARAVQIIDYVKTAIQEEPLRRKEISFDSQQARILFSGKNPEKVSRRDTIRAMRTAEKLWPVMTCDHRPNDGRMTMRLTAKVEDLKDTPPIMEYRDLWQRSDRRVALCL
jgi:hypothetical protein